MQSYQKRISGPLLDRFDLRIEVSNLSQEKLLSDTQSEPSASIRGRVVAARTKQADRFFDSACHVNAEIPPSFLEKTCVMTGEAKTLLGLAIGSQSLSPRAATRIRKVARTIADLAESDRIEEQHLAEALQFRGQKMQRD